jgi:hypothetical protein
MKKENAKDNIEILRQGATSRFWLLIKEALKESEQTIAIEQDSEDMSEMTPEEYKFRNELFKAKRKFLDTLSKTPENIISWLEQPESDVRDFDPYQK